MDDASLEKATSKFPGSCHMMVFPCVAETIDWELFKKKAREGSTEPVNQVRILRNQYFSGVVYSFVIHGTDGSQF